MFKRLIARQLRSPSGLLGYGIAKLMNRGNQSMHLLSIAKLDILPSHRFLDIGFGGGLSFELLLKGGHQFGIVGVETSTTMLKRAHEKFNVSNSAIYLVQSDAHHLPFIHQSFDRICSINTIYFWQQPALAIAEIKRTLTEQGQFALVFRPKQAMEKIKFTQHGFNFYSQNDIEILLREAGFEHLAFHQGADHVSTFYCAIASNYI